MAVTMTSQQMARGFAPTDEAFAAWYIEDVMRPHQPEFYHAITPEGRVDRVLRGLTLAREHGLSHPKAIRAETSITYENSFSKVDDFSQGTVKTPQAGSSIHDMGLGDEMYKKQIDDPNWTRDPNYTWHHKEEDGTTMELVPSAINNDPDPGGLPSMAEVEAWENANSPLPDDYKAFITTYKGGTLWPMLFEHNTSGGKICLSLAKADFGLVRWWWRNMASWEEDDNEPIPIGTIAPSFRAFVFEALFDDGDGGPRWSIPADVFVLDANDTLTYASAWSDIRVSVGLTDVLPFSPKGESWIREMIDAFDGAAFLRTGFGMPKECPFAYAPVGSVSDVMGLLRWPDGRLERYARARVAGGDMVGTFRALRPKSQQMARGT